MVKLIKIIIFYIDYEMGNVDKTPDQEKNVQYTEGLLDQRPEEEEEDEYEKQRGNQDLWLLYLFFKACSYLA